MDALRKVLARMGAEPPHVADLTRRRFIANAGRFGLTAAAAAAMTRHLAMPTPAWGAELPPITDFPAKLKGSGVVRVCSYGGAFQAAQRQEQAARAAQQAEEEDMDLAATQLASKLAAQQLASQQAAQ